MEATGRPATTATNGGPSKEAHSFSVHLRHLHPSELRTISRIHLTSRDLHVLPPRHPNPLVAFLRWWASWAVPGMGMFGEAYTIFAIGNIQPLLAIQYPSCFGETEPRSCSQSAADSVTYAQICGIILGMLALGFAGDLIGRMWGSRLTISIMTVGAVLLTGAYGSSDSQFLAVLLFALFFFGVGVGGEYPMASSSAAERAEGSKDTRKHRGRAVVLTFSQQGWGNLVNTLVILILLAAQGATSAVDSTQAEITWRVQFGVGAAICLGVAVYRWLRLRESAVWTAERQDMKTHWEQQGVTLGHHSSEYWVILRFYLPRLLVTCLAWLCNDVIFYGNKLQMSKFIEVISGGSISQFKNKQWTLLNSAVALVGYYVAAFTMDLPQWGRVRCQTLGFAMLCLLYLLCGALYHTLLDQAVWAFQLLYFLSSFFNQFGPNCTTWLVAGEVYPTAVRSFFHGASAACGQLGALAAAIAFTRVSARATFYACAGAGAVGFLLTALFLPNTTGLDLHEIDRMNRYLLSGQYHNYHGEATNPRHLSRYERWRGYGLFYMPARDREHKRLQGNPH
uniref:Proton/phosphate symporter n=1 Tax=Parachlorella kessleri TaxID=3074 RepID=A0A146HTY8_PARKE|nr:proton/phosphate symporter [Parachlorella kessleri]